MKILSRVLVLCLAAIPAWLQAADVVHGKPAAAASASTPRLRSEGYALPEAVAIRLRAAPKSLEVAAGDDKRLRIGLARDVALEREPGPVPHALAWVRLASGASVARVALVSPGASALRLALRIRGLPQDAELRFFSPSTPDRVLGPVRAAAIDAAMLAAGVYWTGVTEGEEQQVEAWVPAGADLAAARVDIVAASHITVPLSQLAKSTGVGASQACEEDVVCIASSNPALERASRSVAKLVYTDNGVTYLCSGTLVSDGDPASQVPYLYTAAHCIGSQAAAATLNTFWFFEAGSCGGKSASDFKQLSGGATLLYAQATSDVSLVRLNDPAPSGAWFSGWSRAPLEPNAFLVALHHPAGDLQKVSLGQTLAPIGGYNTAAWTSGSTEGGSSGSGLFTLEEGEYVLRGGLRGGSASCASSGMGDDPANRDYYSQIDSQASHLEKWLVPGPAPLANHAGLWFDPDEPGWGVSIAQSPENHVFATWYGYDAARHPLWLVLPQAAWTSAVAFEGALYRASGTGYDEPYDASRFTVAPVGSMRMEFAADGSARLSATIDGTPFVRTIRPQPF